MKQGYLVDIDNQDREHEAILRLLENPIYHHYFFAPLGLHPTASWYLLEIREHLLNDTIHSEIDILAGRVETGSDKIDWSRSTDYLVAIEAKLAYFDLEKNQVKSQKSSTQKVRQIQSKIEELIKSGFNKVVLLDMIANPPATGENFETFINALDRALDSVDKMDALKTRLPDASPAGHWVWPIGSVVGGDETRRGAGAPFELRKACDNNLLGEAPERFQQRQKIQLELCDLLNGLPSNCSRPIVFLDCRNCGKIHNVYDDCKTKLKNG